MSYSEGETLFHAIVVRGALAKFARFKDRAEYHLALLEGKVDFLLGMGNFRSSHFKG